MANLFRDNILSLFIIPVCFLNISVPMCISVFSFHVHFRPSLTWCCVVAWVNSPGVPSLFYLSTIGLFTLTVPLEGWMVQFHIPSPGTSSPRGWGAIWCCGISSLCGFFLELVSNCSRCAGWLLASCLGPLPAVSGRCLDLWRITGPAYALLVLGSEGWWASQGRRGSSRGGGVLQPPVAQPPL
jgi:hypothetical protein